MSSATCFSDNLPSSCPRLLPLPRLAMDQTVGLRPGFSLKQRPALALHCIELGSRLVAYPLGSLTDLFSLERR